MLSVKLFGSGNACFYDRPMDGFPFHHSYLVFCYLLLNRQRTQNRERLASVFWGNYSTNVSRKYLRNALWKLRSVFQSVGAELEDYLQVNDDSIAFLCASPYQLDVETFETLLSNTRTLQGEELSQDQAQQLTQAIELYDGDLLEGVDEEWCLYERERLSLMHLNTLLKLMVYHRSHHMYTLGLEYGERILAFDNTRENVHREIMLLYWLLGEPQLALVQFHRCEQILHDQVGVEPSEETRNLYQQMLHHRFSIPTEVFISAGSIENPKNFSSETAIEYAIHEIRHLRQVIEETTARLVRVEELLEQARINSK
ncbi:MAG: BTAD domain-containing putative transcriptional regulator [Anaerolineaceae bacterium]|jgi:DNA-binding SARP family transcriptional activator